MLYFVPTPIGNLEDISIRSLKLLLSTPLIFCEDTRVTKKLITLLKERFNEKQICEQKFISMHSHNEQDVISRLNASDFLTQDALYVSDAGMPCVSDPGSLLVQFAQQNNIHFAVLPGANALLLALASSGFGGTNFYFHGFLPHKKEAREKEIREILAYPFNSIVYESTHRIDKLCAEFAKIAPKRELFFIKEATKKYETHYNGKAKELADILKTANLNGEWVVVIKGEQTVKGENITQEDILSLSLPNKQKAKLLSKLTSQSVKEWYDRLNNIEQYQ